MICHRKLGILRWTSQIPQLSRLKVVRSSNIFESETLRLQTFSKFQGNLPIRHQPSGRCNFKNFASQKESSTHQHGFFAVDHGWIRFCTHWCVSVWNLVLFSGADALKHVDDYVEDSYGGHGHQTVDLQGNRSSILNDRSLKTLIHPLDGRPNSSTPNPLIRDMRPRRFTASTKYQACQRCCFRKEQSTQNPASTAESCTSYQEKWAKGRCVTDLRFSPHRQADVGSGSRLSCRWTESLPRDLDHFMEFEWGWSGWSLPGSCVPLGEEIFISAYHQKTNPELSDPDGCMLVWFGPQRQSVKSMLLLCEQAFSRKSMNIYPVSAYVMNVMN